MKRVLLLLSLLCVPLDAVAQEQPVDIKQLELKRESGKFMFYRDSQPFTGNAVQYYDSGQKKYEGTMKDGKDHGTATRWYESGQIKSVSNQKNGRLHGTVTNWYENGNMQFEASYEDGQQLSETKWHENGQKYREEKHLNGVLNAVKEWDEKGNLTKEVNY